MIWFLDSSIGSIAWIVVVLAFLLVFSVLAFFESIVLALLLASIARSLFLRTRDWRRRRRLLRSRPAFPAVERCELSDRDRRILASLERRS